MEENVRAILVRRGTSNDPVLLGDGPQEMVVDIAVQIPHDDPASLLYRSELITKNERRREREGTNE
jgi:hypothetical protein